MVGLAFGVASLSVGCESGSSAPAGANTKAPGPESVAQVPEKTPPKVKTSSKAKLDVQ